MVLIKEDFEKMYCEKSDITLDYYYKHFVTLPCYCNDSSCQGWACVSNNELSIKVHNDLYGDK